MNNIEESATIAEEGREAVMSEDDYQRVTNDKQSISIINKRFIKSIRR